MSHFLRKIWPDEEGQDIAEHTVMPFIALGEMGGPHLRITR